MKKTRTTTKGKSLSKKFTTLMGANRALRNDNFLNQKIKSFGGLILKK
jgi:hypothetical protein